MVRKYVANNIHVSLRFLLHLRDQGTMMELGADPPSGQLRTYTHVGTILSLSNKSSRSGD